MRGPSPCSRRAALPPQKITVYDGDNPTLLARDFAIKNKLNADGMKSVLTHLKQKALLSGNMKRVFFQLPVQVEKHVERGGGETPPPA